MTTNMELFLSRRRSLSALWKLFKGVISCAIHRTIINKSSTINSLPESLTCGKLYKHKAKMGPSLNVFPWLGIGLAISTLVHSVPMEHNNAITKRAPVEIKSAGPQVSIDPLGAYVRACHLDDGSIFAPTTTAQGRPFQPLGQLTEAPPRTIPGWLFRKTSTSPR